MNFVNLRKTGFGWEFETEADLEDFVWANLQQLLGLTPLKRQHYVKGYVSSGIVAKITSYKNLMAKRIEKLNEIANENRMYSSTLKYMRQYCKDRNIITRKLSNHEPLTYEDMKLMEVDHYGLGIYEFEKYEDLDKLIDLALETWLKRL